MYNYSPIKYLVIKNFRNIGEAIIDMSDTPIISLVGENESGKTSVVKAFTVCGLNSSPRDQKDFVRDGTKAFGIGIELEDGTVVERVKFLDGLNRYRLRRNNKIVFQTEKIDSGVPLEIQSVMGLLEEPETKEYLQVRTYEDPLLFVVTPSSTNYKVMYDALKVEQLTKAISLGSKEANELKYTIDKNNTGISTLYSNLRKIRTFDITPLINIKNRIIREHRQVENIDSAYKIYKDIEKKKEKQGLLWEITNSEQVKETEVIYINSILDTIHKLSDLNSMLSIYKNISELEEIDTSLIDSLEQLDRLKNDIKEKEAKLSSLSALSNIDEVSEYEVNILSSILDSKNKLLEASRKDYLFDVDNANYVEEQDIRTVELINYLLGIKDKLRNLMETENEYKKYIEMIESYLKSTGIGIETCPNCGTEIIVSRSEV